MTADGFLEGEVVL